MIDPFIWKPEIRLFFGVLELFVLGEQTDQPPEWGVANGCHWREPE
jgi:hypothetical protein